MFVTFISTEGNEIVFYKLDEDQAIELEKLHDSNGDEEQFMIDMFDYDSMTMIYQIIWDDNVIVSYNNCDISTGSQMNQWLKFK